MNGETISRYLRSRLRLKSKRHYPRSTLHPARIFVECAAVAQKFGYAANAAPVTEAGVDQSVTAGSQATLDGSGTSDPDGDTLTVTEATASNGTVVLQTDVTDLIRLERKERARLQNKQARLIAATLEHLNQGVCIFDDAARLIGWNARVAELLRLPLTRVQRGASFGGLIAQLPEDFALSHGMSRKRLLDWADRPARRGALRFEATQGAALTLDAFAQGLPDGGFVISFTDVTAERNAARALREMNERLEARVAERTTELASALAEAERALATVQTLDPTGVGARSLAECLALQAREADRYDPCMARLIDNLELVVAGDIARLKRMCEVDDEDFADMLAELRGYDPRPGLTFGEQGGSAVVPDILISPATDGGWRIALNEATLPRLVVNRPYLVELRDGCRDRTSRASGNRRPSTTVDRSSSA